LPAESLDRLSAVAIVIRRALRSPELTARPVRLQRFGASPSSGWPLTCARIGRTSWNRPARAESRKIAWHIGRESYGPERQIGPL